MVPCKKSSTFITFLFPLFYMPLKMEIIISKYTLISPVAPMPKNSASEVSSMEKMTSGTCKCHLISSFQHLSASSFLRSHVLTLPFAISGVSLLAILRLLFWLMYWKLSALSYTIAPF